MQALDANINGKRGCGKIITGFATLSTTLSAELSKAHQIDFACLSPVDAAMAQKIIVAIMFKDMAYHAQCMPLVDAQEIWQDFLALFQNCNVANMKFYTNATFKSYKNSLALDSWSPVTQHTFDTGIVAVCGSQYGVIWVADED